MHIRAAAMRVDAPEHVTTEFEVERVDFRECAAKLAASILYQTHPKETVIAALMGEVVFEIAQGDRFNSGTLIIVPKNRSPIAFKGKRVDTIAEYTFTMVVTDHATV